MADEQTIYISPDDDLTTVRERLEQIPSRRVTLVIPAQTQLRSHVAWKLLYARARELGRDVLIVSSDPQVRSVAHAVKFKVAHSLESSQSGKSRPSSRPVRSGVGVRSRSAPSLGSRTAPGRGQAGSRGTGGLRSRQAPSPEREQWYGSVPEAAPSQPEPEGPVSHPDEVVTGGLHPSSGSTFDPSERTAPGLEPYREYDFRLDASPPIQPISPQQIEEPDLLFEDYNLAQDIRQAASETGKMAVPPNELLRSFHATPQPGMADDPFAYMEDLQAPPRIAEQRGAVSIEGYSDDDEYITGGGHVVEDVSEMPTEIIDGEIEYQGDTGEFVPPTNQPSQPGWIEQEEKKETPVARRSGYLPSVQPQEVDDDALPPVEERPTQIVPPPITLPTVPQREVRQPAPVANRGAEQRPPVQRSRVPALSKPPARQPRQARGASQRPPAANRGAGAQQRVAAARLAVQRRAPVGLIAIIVIALLVIGCLAYFGPAADVAITLDARSFSRPLTLTARPDKQAGAIPAQRMTKEFTTSGTGKATGSKMVGSAIAKGSVTFTNNGTKAVEIPTGTIVATAGANSVQFQTTADAVIPPGADNALPVPVQAVKPGDTGNKPAGAISVIPDDSLRAIAQYPTNSGVAPADLKLSVNNPQGTTGGGVQPATTVASKDLDSLKNSLHQQIMQTNVAAWLKQLSETGVVGSPVVTNEALTNAPQVDQVENSGSFTAGYSMSVAVLQVPNSDLQRAVIAQLQSLLRGDKNYSNYILATDVQPAVKIAQMKASSPDANSLKLTFDASGMAVPNISKESVQRMIAGTSLRTAKATLSQIKGVQKVDITPSPGFIWFVPAWPEHIHVVLKSGAAQPAK